MLLGEMCARRLEGGRGRKGWSSLPKELGSINSAPAVLRNCTLMVAELKEDNVLFLSSYRETGKESYCGYGVSFEETSLFFFYASQDQNKEKCPFAIP